MQSFQLDPNAKAYTDNEIIFKINNGTDKLFRWDVLDKKLLRLVETDPLPGEYYIRAIQRTASGELDVHYDDIPVP